MQYYHDIITEKSFQFLQELKKQFRLVLIGGWAVFLHTRSLKSKDIDIVVDYEELGAMKKKFNVSKNDRLKKYEIKTGELDVDIYLPHYSELGIGAEEIQKSQIIKDGFNVPGPEILFMLKIYAWNQRRGSAKGRKDELDILNLVSLPEFNWSNYKNLVKRFDFKIYHDLFLDFLKKTTRVPELGWNEQKTAKIKRSVLNNLT